MMTANNLSVVFGPNLTWPTDQQVINCSLVFCMLVYSYSHCFGMNSRVEVYHEDSKSSLIFEVFGDGNNF